MNSILALIASNLVLLLVQSALSREVSVSSSSLKSSYTRGELIFQEEFDRFNTSRWQYEVNMNGGYNQEFQIYDKYGENAYVRDGILYIRPSPSVNPVFKGNWEQLYNGYIQLQGCTDPEAAHCSHQGHHPYINPPIVSARLRTKGTFSFRYGRIEIKARNPSADWTWPAIWLLPEDEKYGGWPRSGEIDIMESRGNRKLFINEVNIGSEQMGSTLHFGPSPNQNGWSHAHGQKNTAPDQGYDRNFHTYVCEWTPNNMRFLVDGSEVKNVVPPAGGFWELGQFPRDQTNPWAAAENKRMAPFDQKFHFILNVATGGIFFPRDSRPAPPWGSETAFWDFWNARDSWLSTWSEERAAMAIDYIRVYAV